jgi:hypothetical protein
VIKRDYLIVEVDEEKRSLFMQNIETEFLLKD